MKSNLYCAFFSAWKNVIEPLMQQNKTASYNTKIFVKNQTNDFTRLYNPIYLNVSKKVKYCT